MHPIISALLTLAGLGLLGYALWVAYLGARTGTWPRAKGKIVSAVIQHGDASSEQTPRLDVSYSFEVKGQSYFGDRLRIGGNAVGRDQLAQAAWYRAGREVWVAYDPADPRNNVLDPGLDESTILRWAVSGVICVIVGLLGLYGFF